MNKRLTCRAWIRLRQACKTQITLRAAKATKTAKGAAKAQSGPHFTKNYTFNTLNCNFHTKLCEIIE